MLKIFKKPHKVSSLIYYNPEGQCTVGYHLTLQRLPLMTAAFALGLWVSGYDGLYRGTINKKRERTSSRREKIHRILAFSKVFFHMTLSDKIDTNCYPCDNKMEIQDHFRVKCAIKPLRTGFQERANRASHSFPLLQQARYGMCLSVWCCF